MATSSTIPSAKAALVSLIGAALSGVQVTYARPADGRLERECVWVGDTTGQHRVPTFNAVRTPREETYGVEVVAWVANDRGTAQEAEDRCFELIAEVEDIVANDTSLGLATATTPVFWATVGQFDTAAEEEPPASVVRLTINCTARLA